MDKLNQEKEIVKVEKKLADSKSSSFTSELRGLDENNLKQKLLELAMKRQDIITAQKEDAELQDAKETVKELNAPYADAKRENDLISRFVSLLIEEKKGC